VPTFGGEQERALDAGRVHARDHRFEADAVEGVLADTHLVDVEVLARRARRQRFGRPEVDDGVDGLNIVAHELGVPDGAGVAEQLRQGVRKAAFVPSAARFQQSLTQPVRIRLAWLELRGQVA
jgi:hypothetical protein